MVLARLFEHAADQCAERLAITTSRGGLTYGQLRARVDALASTLIDAGIGSGARVGVGVARSVESMIAVLGIIRAGAAYVPVDPAHPLARQRLVADDAELSALVVDGDVERAAAITRAPTFDLSATVASGRALPPVADDPDALLYILYTSGSTGRPKGVCGRHGATLNRLRWGWEAMPLEADAVVAHRSALGFVDAAPEMFTGLLAGMPTAIIAPEEVADLGRLLETLRRQSVTRITVVPSLLAAMLRARPDLGAVLPRLRTWITSGEELGAPLLRHFREAHPDATLVNIYGTTEVTGDVTWARFAPGDPLPEARVPIGVAMADAELIVLDRDGTPVADGEIGELYVGGPPLAAGYHRRPGEDAVRFPKHPTRPGERVFRTGDLVRRDAAGVLEYIGRADNLVKVRGVRIELEEVERAIAGACREVGACAVCLVDERLVAAVTPASLDVERVRVAAAAILSDAMMPARFVALPDLPLSPNGKTDRKAVASRIREWILGSARVIEAARRPSGPTQLAIAELWSAALRRPDIACDDRFAALGGDSLASAELVVALERIAGARRVGLELARQATLAELAAAIDDPSHSLGAELDCRAPVDPPLADDRVRAELELVPFGECIDDPATIAMFVEAAADPALCAATELPARLDEARARAYLQAQIGLVLRLRGVPVGAAIVQPHPNIGEGVETPAGAVQLDEWLLPRYRGLDLLGPRTAWPAIRDWLAARYDDEVSVVWEDNLAMLAILRARGYTRVGRSYWRSTPEGDGTEGWCEVWTFDLRPYRR